MQAQVFHFDDIGYSLEVTPGAYQAGIRVWRLIAWEPRGWELNQNGAYTITDTMKDADLFIEGYVKWDACSNLTFNDPHMHFCGRLMATNIGVLLGRIYDIAQPNIEYADPRMFAEG